MAGCWSLDEEMESYLSCQCIIFWFRWQQKTKDAGKVRAASPVAAKEISVDAAAALAGWHCCVKRKERVALKFVLLSGNNVCVFLPKCFGKSSVKDPRNFL